jgi:hypothetical protein
VILLQLDIRELVGDAGDDLIPQHHRMLQGVRFGRAREHLPRPRLRQAERVAGNPLDALSREDAGLLGHLVRRAAVQPSADAAVLALRILAHADHVDIFGAAARERRRDAWQQPHRPQIHPLSEPLTQRQDQLTRRDVIGDTRIADRAEINRVERHQPIDAVVVHHAPVLQVVIAPPRDLRELADEVALFGGEIQDVDAGRDHFLADSVTRDHCYAISLHLMILPRKASTPTNPIPAAINPDSVGSSHRYVPATP